VAKSKHKQEEPTAPVVIEDDVNLFREAVKDARPLTAEPIYRHHREGHAPDILSKLRRGHWVVQGAIDLHGLISDEARVYVAAFLNDCKKRGLRCVRIVHGKGLGSRNREPVLKHKLRNWLMQRDEVIAYAEARRQDGGSGAVIVLLKAG
jgi:DNA-nicking Smr family endonuclease